MSTGIRSIRVFHSLPEESFVHHQATAVVCARLQESSAAPHARCGQSGYLTYRSSTVTCALPIHSLITIYPTWQAQAKRPPLGPVYNQVAHIFIRGCVESGTSSFVLWSVLLY